MLSVCFLRTASISGQADSHSRHSVPSGLWWQVAARRFLLSTTAVFVLLNLSCDNMLRALRTHHHHRPRRNLPPTHRMPLLQRPHVHSPRQHPLPTRQCPRAGKTMPITLRSLPSRNSPIATSVPISISRSTKTSKRLCDRFYGNSAPPSDTLLHTAVVSLHNPPINRQQVSLNPSPPILIHQRL